LQWKRNCWKVNNRTAFIIPAADSNHLIIFWRKIVLLKTTDMTVKTEKKILFSTDLNWAGDEKGIISSPAVRQSIPVSAPAEFGGVEGEWSPEHLFLGSVASCFMSTFLAFVKKIRFDISGFECSATGQVEVAEGKYKFTSIHLYPKVYIKNESEKEKAQLAMEKAEKYCLISNSINAEIVCHPEIVPGKPGIKDPVKTTNGHRRFSSGEAREIGQKIGVDFSKFDLGQFRRGLEVEMEHGTAIRESNVTNDDLYITGKIAWAHLHEIPDYYTRLDKMEKEAEAGIN
jgi:peroxiredoxin-like protein